LGRRRALHSDRYSYLSASAGSIIVARRLGYHAQASVSPYMALTEIARPIA
jgi:hypothetical protein